MSVRAFLSYASLVLAACNGDDNVIPTDAGAKDVTVDAPAAEAAAPDASPAEAGASSGVGQIDRMGRPGINVLLNDRALSDAYNGEDTYASPFPGTYDNAFERHLEALDVLKLDGTHPDTVDFPPVGGVHPLRDALKQDVLLVDLGKPCANAGAFAPSYLDLEAELFLGAPAHQTCGGRTPSEDVMSKTLTVLVTNGRAPVKSGVAAATKPASTTFPYLADPN